jgi:tetratricopeptide (TPR) repeat protein
VPLFSFFFFLFVQQTPALPRGGQADALTLPDYARALYRGDYAGAANLAAARLKTQPDDVQARIVLARAEAARGRFDAAYAGFRKALVADPKNPDALYFLGITAGALAQAEYERLLALAPESARAHQLRGQADQAEGKSADAEAEYKAAVQAGPPTPEVLIALGDLVRHSRLDFTAARGYYARALELAPGSYDALYGVGVCDSYAGEHAKAIVSFRQALRVAPDSAPARLALGISLLQTGQTEEAATELERAAKLEPGMRQAYYQLGRAYQTLGRTKEAQAAFSRAQELIQQERAGSGNIPEVGTNPVP